MALPLQNNVGVMPTAYLNLKTYYEDFGKYVDEWHWPKPTLYHYTFDTLMKDLHQHSPTILALGGYVWNIDLCYRLAIEVKRIWPNCIVVAGGPQPEYLYDQEYFKKHLYIDVVIPFDGEMPLTDIIDQVTENKIEFSQCANVVYPTSFGWNHSIKQLSAADFKWKRSPIIAQQDIMSEYIKEYKQKGLRIEVYTDTTRGCPYKCTFCDWGGNSQTKLRQKPMDMVKDEIRFLCDSKVDHIKIIDANFGILKRDIAIAKLYVEEKNRTGYPETIMLLNAKNNKKELTEIHKLLFNAGIDAHLAIGMQDFNSEVRNNIRRTDLTLVEHLTMYHDILNSSKKKNLDLEVLCILGLPGQSFQTLIDDVNEVVEHNIMFPAYNNFMLLPNSPAADPEYIEQWKIVSKKSPLIAMGAVAKKNKKDTTFGKATISTSDDAVAANIVIETSSFDSYEFIKMRSFTAVMTAIYSAGLFRVIGFGLHKFKGVSYSDFYEAIFSKFLAECSSPVKEFKKYMETQLEEVIFSDELTRFEFDSRWLGSEFPFLLPIQFWWRLHLMWHSKIIYEDIRDWLKTQGWYDETIEDLLIFNENYLITPSYDPIVGRTWTNEYDWLSWYENITTNSIEPVTIGEPIQGLTTYTTNQDTVTFANHTMDIKWHECDNEADKLLEYFYKTCFGTKIEIFFTEINSNHIINN